MRLKITKEEYENFNAQEWAEKLKAQYKCTFIQIESEFHPAVALRDSTFGPFYYVVFQLFY